MVFYTEDQEIQRLYQYMI